jgi:predicted O-linked N-acetylglucosamine transferase (SPINDLY family)
MDPFTYFLAFSRLAPIQCTTWGHPDTTGIPNMDYYISSEKAEPPGAQDHYTEQLILFKQFPMFCHRPQAPRQRLSRKDFDLADGDHVYACTQNLFKVHPDFDQILAGILQLDPDASILLFEGKHPHWTKLLQERLVQNLGDHYQNLRFLRRLSETDFYAFLQIPDVILDTPHFSGGYTSLLAFAQGVPIVTWPGGFMRGRLTGSFYEQMGVMDCVADGFDTYVNIAVNLANNPAIRNDISRKIKESSHCLYENFELVHELERFFQWAIERHQKTGN